MRYVVLLCVFIMSFGSPIAAQANCGTENRLLNTEFGRVTPGVTNLIRSTPSQQGEIISKLEGGKAFEVIGEATCADGFTWIPAKFTTREGFWWGWTAESDATTYFLEPVSGFVLADHGVTAILPAEVATSAHITFYKKEPETAERPWTAPEYMHITFKDYADETRRAVITIYRIDTINNAEGDSWMGALTYVIEEMSSILENHPDLTSFDALRHRLPLFEMGVAANFLAYRDYLPFQNGDGYHALTAWGQDIFAPTNESLEYNYVGITNDGRYFLKVEMPVDASELPYEEGPIGFEDIKGVEDFLDALPPESYTPPLPLIDMLIETLYIGD